MTAVHASSSSPHAPASRTRYTLSLAAWAGMSGVRVRRRRKRRRKRREEEEEGGILIWIKSSKLGKSAGPPLASTNLDLPELL